MEVRLGINTCFAVKRWPRPEDWAPIIAGRLGLRLVQHSLDLEDGRRVAANGAAGAAEGGVAGAAAILAAASEHGLTVHSTFTGLGAYSRNLLLDPEADARQAARSYLRAAIDLTAALGGVATGGHVGAFSVVDWTDPARRTTRWADLRSSLAELAMDARRAGLEYLMVENLAAAREPSTMAMIRDLLTEGDTERVPIRLCLDVGHMCVPGTAGPDRDPYAWLRELGAAAPVVQLQQSDAGGDHHWPFTPARNAEGRIDARRVLEALVDGGVAETALILEVIPAFEQDDDEVLDDLERSADHWREALVASHIDVV